MKRVSSNTHHTLQQRPSSVLEQAQAHQQFNDLGDDVDTGQEHAHHALRAVVRVHQVEHPRLDREQGAV